MDAKVNIMKGPARASATTRFDLSTVPVPRKYLAPLPLKPAKLKDLRELLPGLVPTYFMDHYWTNIIGEVDRSSNVEEEDDPEVMFSQVFDY